MSLRWRIMGATVFVVVLAVLTTASVGYYATQARLGVFVDQIGEDEAIQLAQNLSREYTAAGGWGTVDRVLSESGDIYGEVQNGERHLEGEGESNEGLSGESEESSDPLHKDRVRVVIAAIDGLVVKDNLSELPPGTAAPELGGRQETVFDLATNKPVGHVYVDVNREFLSTESHGFLSTLLYLTLIGGTATAGVAILLAAWLSKRITAPVTALTEATQGIAQGDSTRLPVTSSDELGRMSAAFNQMATDLETQRELRRRLINDVSHELNTPLSVIQLEAQGLSDGLQTAESASDHIVQEVGRLRGLVTDLNSLAETDYGELRLTLESSSIYELLTAEVRRWLPQSQARQIELSLNTSDDLPDIALDRMRMSQAFGNVISNSLRSTEGGGSIDIKARLEGDGALAVSITDDGIGIDAVDIPHVFDRFYRTDQSRRGGILGTGLGLAITRAIIEEHGGTVSVKSDGVGQGATVIIRLPLNDSVLSAAGL